MQDSDEPPVDFTNFFANGKPKSQSKPPGGKGNVGQAAALTQKNRGRDSRKKGQLATQQNDKKRKRLNPQDDWTTDSGATPKPANPPEKDKKKARIDKHFWSFEVDYCDHFETSFRAVKDIAPVLQLLCKKLKKSPSALGIYDPFFCKGGVRRHYEKLGFTNFIHRNRDFYKDVVSDCVPEHDILVTNPPYSADHKERILEFCLRSGKPWALLLPNYVATKAYFAQLLTDTDTPAQRRPFFLTPSVRYSYDHPEGTGHAESPFFSIWYVGLGPHTESVYGTCRAQLDQVAGARTTGGSGGDSSSSGGEKGSKKAAGPAPASDGGLSAGGDGWAVSLARSVDGLRQAGAVPTARRLNPKQRQRLKQSKLKAGSGAE